MSSFGTTSKVAVQRLAIRVKPEAERALRDGHPWVFAQAIVKQSAPGRSGDLAVVFDRKNRFLAIGLYDPHSEIRVRILQHHSPATIDSAWMAEKIAESVARRISIASNDTTGLRLVHGENDGLPGLVVDRYDQTVVLKIYSAAWITWLGHVVAAIEAVLRPSRIVLRLSRAVSVAEPDLNGYRNGELLLGEPPDSGVVLFRESGFLFEADVLSGQKTGFFLDQRENRRRVMQLAGNRTVLNVFSYSGAFSIYAAAGGAREVASLDSNRMALDAAARHFELNENDPEINHTKHDRLRGDAFELLREMAVDGRRFDLVILDPPAFASRSDQVDRALVAYQRLARLGIDLLPPGGLLVASSCSAPVTSEAFYEALHLAARKRGCPLIELERSGHAPDHPIGFRQGAYLKTLFARIP